MLIGVGKQYLEGFQALGRASHPQKNINICINTLVRTSGAGGVDLGLTCVKGRYYWVKRVPKRFASVARGQDGHPVSQVRVALRTDSLSEAKSLAPQVEAQKLAEWEAALAGDQGAQRAHFLATKRLCETKGYPYVPLETLLEDPESLVRRVLELGENGISTASVQKASAVLGTVPNVLPSLNEVLTAFVVLTETRHLQKSEAQKHKWFLPRQRAVRNFLNVFHGTELKAPKDAPLEKIDRSAALKFRKWWSERIKSGMKVESANKDFTHLSQMIATWASLTESEYVNPFKGLRLDGIDKGTTPPFSREWVTGRLLARGALDGLNEDARDVLLVMVNTGLRPSEITDAPIEDIILESDIPYWRVAPNGLQLKVINTARDIPLLGVSLEAATRIRARGGVSRYRNKTGSWSALVNKYLKTNGLKETEKHVAYSLRHYVEDALLAARIDDRIRADILGHKYKRPNYGTGGGLAGRNTALQRICI